MVSLLGYSVGSRESFKLIYVVLAAANIVQTCMVGQELPWGGTADLVGGRVFVKVAGLERGEGAPDFVNIAYEAVMCLIASRGVLTVKDERA